MFEFDVSSLQTRQRILQRRHKRVSVRLEKEFWTQLELAAQDEGLKLTDIVFRIWSGEPSESNRTSALRVYCVQWLREKLGQARVAAANLEIKTILAACPLPSVVVTHDRRIAAHNPAFAEQVLNVVTRVRTGVGPTGVLRLSIDKQLGDIARDAPVAPLGYVEALVQFSGELGTIMMTGRFCTLGRRGTESAPLLCFLRRREGTRPS